MCYVGDPATQIAQYVVERPMDVEAMLLTLKDSGPVVLSVGLVLIFLRPVRNAVVDWFKAKTKDPNE